MAWLAPFLVGRIPVSALANPPALVELFAETITEELDFRLEAENMLDVAQAYASLDQRGFVIPRPHPVLVTRRMLVMERLEGFKFEDVVGMKDADIDTEAIVRTGMIGFMEGTMIHGIFHGDLHGGNLLRARPTAAPPCSTSASPGACPRSRGWRSSRLLVGATTQRPQRPARRPARPRRASPPDVDLDGRDRATSGLDQPAVDPDHAATATSWSARSSARSRRCSATAPRCPKELMLFVKNMVFLDGAIATLAPTSTCSPRSPQHLDGSSPRSHGRADPATELGLDTRRHVSSLDLAGVKASFGVDDSDGTMTYRDLQERRALIRENMQSAAGGRRRRGRRKVARCGWSSPAARSTTRVGSPPTCRWPPGCSW